MKYEEVFTRTSEQEKSIPRAILDGIQNSENSVPNPEMKTWKKVAIAAALTGGVLAAVKWLRD